MFPALKELTVYLIPAFGNAENRMALEDTSRLPRGGGPRKALGLFHFFFLPPAPFKKTGKLAFQIMTM